MWLTNRPIGPAARFARACVLLAASSGGCAAEQASPESESSDDALSAQIECQPDAGAVDEQCKPGERGPEATPVTVKPINEVFQGDGVPPSGPYRVSVESDPGLPTHTVWRPAQLGGTKHPILAWGMGGCAKDSTGNGVFTELLREFVSQGIVVISDGTPGGKGPSSGGGMGAREPLIKAIDWAIKENERPCSKYYHKLDVTKIAVAGQSCGGLMAINASTDPRVTTAMPMNSGLFARDQKLYAALHAPMAIIDGGPDDIAYANGKADFQAITSIPLLFANLPIQGGLAHIGTLRDDNAGEFGRISVAWLRWHLFGDQGSTGKGMFIGSSCGLCGSKWDLQWKQKPQ